MRRRAIPCIGLLGGLVAVFAAAGTGRAAPNPRIDPQADRALQRMCRYLQSLKQFRVRATELNDVVRGSGQKVRSSTRRVVAVRRPNRLTSDATGDTADRRFWYNGKNITLLDRRRNLYASAPAAGSIDGMLQQIANTYGLHVPLSDLLKPNLYANLTDKVTSGVYLGLHQVGRLKAHHLAFSQDAVDWQIWVENGERPLPRKVIITYKEWAGQPQYQATLDVWELSPSLPDSAFRFRAPKGAAKISIIPAGGTPANLRTPKTEGKTGTGSAGEKESVP